MQGSYLFHAARDGDTTTVRILVSSAATLLSSAGVQMLVSSAATLLSSAGVQSLISDYFSCK
jgi:hypothetical protein